MMRPTATGILTAVTLLLPTGIGATQAPPQEAAGTSGADGNDTKVHFMNVEIWPEYDDPRVLVIYSGALEPGLEMPRDFSFLVPTGAEVHMAGAVAESGGHIHGLYETRDRGDGLTEVSYSLPNPNFYMEFYYDPLGDDDLRDFSYPLVSPYAISQLRVNVQHPRRATEFAVAPATTQVVQDDKGLSYHAIRFDSLTAGESRSVSVRYKKSDRNFSVVAQDGSGAEVSDKRAMKSILVFSALLLLGVVGYGVFTTTRKGAGRPTRDIGGTQQPRSESGRRGPIAGADFCTQCGERTAATDKFCGKCGHPVPHRHSAHGTMSSQ